MSFGKSFGITVLFYVLLNFVFMLVYVALGGLVDVGTASVVSIGDFFTQYLADDVVGFICTLFVPGGGVADPLFGIMNNLNNLFGETPNWGVSIISLLWIILPGLISALIAGFKFSDESSKSAFFGVLVAILVVTIIPEIFSIFGLIDPTSSIVNSLIPAIYYPGDGIIVEWVLAAYFVPPIVGFFNGAFFGGWAAMASNNL